jgi:hypothetical protein
VLTMRFHHEPVLSCHENIDFEKWLQIFSS